MTRTVYHAKMVPSSLDIYQTHRDVMALFPTIEDSSPRQHMRVLYIVDGHVARIQSTTPPLCAHTTTDVRAGQDGWMRFQSVASPQKREARTGKIVALPHEQTVDWFASKLLGFESREIRVTDRSVVSGRKGSHAITHLRVRVEGDVRVTDWDAAVRTMIEGIGRGRSFGLGLVDVEGLNHG